MINIVTKIKSSRWVENLDTLIFYCFRTVTLPSQNKFKQKKAAGDKIIQKIS